LFDFIWRQLVSKVHLAYFWWFDIFLSAGMNFKVMTPEDIAKEMKEKEDL